MTARARYFSGLLLFIPEPLCPGRGEGLIFQAAMLNDVRPFTIIKQEEENDCS
jgi:hypothetical protein